METDFKNAWKIMYEKKRASIPEERANAHEEFALSNRQRARDLIKYLQSVLSFDFKRKRILDIGSAYGGFVIECARMGAEAYGIERESELMDLALANALNETGHIKLIHNDVLDAKVMEETDRGPFDLIVLNDVFEHVYDSVRLFDRISGFSGPNTVVYFEIPNGDSYSAIEQEGHFFRFGLSLLEPSEWRDVVDGFNVYYRPLSLYQLQFQTIGFPYVYLRHDGDLVETASKEVRTKFAALEKQINAGPFDRTHLNEKIKRRFAILKQSLEHDLRRNNPLELHLKYERDFWTGLATTARHPILDKTPGLIRLNLHSEGSNSREATDIAEPDPGLAKTPDESWSARSLDKQAVQILTAQLTEKREKVESLIAQVVDRQSAVESLGAQLAERHEKVLSLTELVAERQRAVDLLAERLAEKEQTLQVTAATLTRGSEELEVVKAQAAEAHNTVESLVSQLAEKEQTIQRLADQLAGSEYETKALSAQMAAKDAEVERITNTLGWRLLSLYGKIKYPYLLFLYRLIRRMPREPKGQNERPTVARSPE